MSKWLLGDVKHNITRSPDPEILVFLHVWTGPSVTLEAGMGHLRGKMLKYWIDNSGLVYINKKGYSTSCSLCSTIVKATATLATTFGCRVEVAKIVCCSSPMAVMADFLTLTAKPSWASLMFF